jgi:hypothetical protein
VDLGVREQGIALGVGQPARVVAVQVTERDDVDVVEGETELAQLQRELAADHRPAAGDARAEPGVDQDVALPGPDKRPDRHSRWRHPLGRHVLVEGSRPVG